jgi:hypothetical protein
LSNKFNTIVPLVKDDSLMNLLAFVTDQFSEESDPTVAKKMRTLMLVVVKAAGESMNEGLAECNKNIREFGRWITSFSPDVRLMPTLNEDFHRSPWHDDANQDAAEAKALDEFDCDEFLQSEYAEDLDRDNEVPVSEVQSALEAYLRSWIETQTGEYVDDVAGIAEQKMSEVIAHLARDGMHITSDEYAESELVEDDMDAGMGGDMDAADAYHMGDEDHREILDDMMDEDDDMGDDMGADMVDEDLTREDILLPNPNQGQDLAREVTPRTVKDPDTGEDKQPDSAYISRLRALSGITSPNRQF